MKIIRQLSQWMLETKRLSLEDFNEIRHRILGDPLTEDDVYRANVERERREEREESECAWWNLHGAGIRTGTQDSAHHKTGRSKVPNVTAVKVWDLEPLLPGILTGGNATFELPYLLRSVASSLGKRFAGKWEGFAACAEFLYKQDADSLHHALHDAVVRDGKRITRLLFAMERGDSLFPSDFLKSYSGRSVSIIRKRIAGESSAFIHGKTDWILRYPNFNSLNEACLVRNRIRRIFRLWIAESIETVDNVWDAEHPNGGAALRLDFGMVHVTVPIAIWLSVRSASNAAIPGCELVGLTTNGDEVTFPVRVDGEEREATDAGWIELLPELRYQYEVDAHEFKRQRGMGLISNVCFMNFMRPIYKAYREERSRHIGMKKVTIGNLCVKVMFDGSDWGFDISNRVCILSDPTAGVALVWTRKGLNRRGSGGHADAREEHCRLRRA